MPRHVRLRELLLGIEGLALLRRLYDSSDDEADERVAEARRIVNDPEYATSEAVVEADPRTGYRAWSATYDEPGNPIIALEQPIVWSLIDTTPSGRALDVGCGTGRHTLHLSELGHEVIACDYTAEMLKHAKAAAPDVSFVEADVRSLPVRAESFDLVVSALVLAHVAELHVAVRELSRVLRPGGRMVLSVLHPLQAQLGWHAPFADAIGARGFVREYAHTHADYLNALFGAGMRITDCIEPALTRDEVLAKRRAVRHIPEATMAAYTGLPAVLILGAKKFVA